jgi:hypothetical protein
MSDWTERLEPFDLFNHQSANLGTGENELLTPEIRFVRVTRMSSDLHTAAHRQLRRFAHRRRVARVTSASDVGRRNEGHEGRVLTGSFTEIAVQIDPHHFS